MFATVLSDRATKRKLGTVTWSKLVGSILTKFVMDNAEAIQTDFSALQLSKYQGAIEKLFTREQLGSLDPTLLPHFGDIGKRGPRPGAKKREGEGSVRDADKQSGSAVRRRRPKPGQVRRELAALTAEVTKQRAGYRNPKQRRKIAFRPRGPRLLTETAPTPTPSSTSKNSVTRTGRIFVRRATS